MKVKVIQRYVDIMTKETMEIGTTAEYSPERAKTLITKGFVEPAKNEAVEEKDTAKPKTEPKKKPKKK